MHRNIKRRGTIALVSVVLGLFAVTAADDSNMQLTITDSSGTTVLELDSDGNGTAEDMVTTSWDELN